MATAKGKSTRAKNPGQLKLAGGTTAKKPAVRKNTSAAKSGSKKKTTYRRNPSPGTNVLLFVVGGVASLKAFDLLLRYLAPSIGNTVSILATAGVGFGINNFVAPRLPAGLRSWANIAAIALYFKAGLSAWDEWVQPYLPPAFGGTAGVPQVVGPPAQIVNQETGAMGLRYPLSTGEFADVWGLQPELIG